MFRSPSAINAPASRQSSIFLQRIVGVVFMRVNSKRAHQVRPPRDRFGCAQPSVECLATRTLAGTPVSLERTKRDSSVPICEIRFLTLPVISITMCN